MKKILLKTSTKNIEQIKSILSEYSPLVLLGNGVTWFYSHVKFYTNDNEVVKSLKGLVEDLHEIEIPSVKGDYDEEDGQTLIDCPNCENWECASDCTPRNKVDSFGIISWKEEELCVMECRSCKKDFHFIW